VRYPRPAPGTVSGFVEFARRLGDFAIAGAATMLRVRNGICEAARLTIVGMGRGPFRARDAEAALAGRKVDAAAIADAAAKVVAAIDPAEDVHASAAYRRHLAGVMATRALEQASARAGVS
jgi:carbon-monoxide dehydrogenase medium subunit